MDNSVIDDFSVVHGSSKCRVLIHVHNGKIYLFCRNLRQNDVYGYKADITAMNGISSKELLTHEYQELWFTLTNAYNIIGDEFEDCRNIAALLAFDGSATPIFLKEISKDIIHKGFSCKCYKRETGAIVVSANINDLFNLDPVDYKRLIIAGNDYEDIFAPSLTMMNAIRFNGLYEITKTYFSECPGNASNLIKWVGEDSVNGLIRNDESILDLALLYGVYSDVEFLSDRGYRISIVNDTSHVSYCYDCHNQQSYFNLLDNLILLFRAKVGNYTFGELRGILRYILSKMKSLSRLDLNFWPIAPSLEDIRIMDNKLLEYIIEIANIVPSEVFGSSIIFNAVGALNLFPRSFSKILEISIKAGANLMLGGKSIFSELYRNRSFIIAPSWLIYEALDDYKSIMTKKESSCFVDVSKKEDFYVKAETGALLFQLLIRRGEILYGLDDHKATNDGTDSMILQLLDVIDPEFVNPLGVSIMLQACLSSVSTFDAFRMKLIEKGVDPNICDTFNRNPLKCMFGRKEFCSFLIANGADLKAVSADNEFLFFLTELHLSEDSWHLFDCLEDKSFLFSLNKRNESLFFSAIKNRNIGAIRYLGRNGFVRAEEADKIHELTKSIKNSELRAEITGYVDKAVSEKAGGGNDGKQDRRSDEDTRR